MAEQTVREFLTEYCEKKGWGSDEDMLIEALIEAKTANEGNMDEHRWYIVQPVVKEIEGKFISFYHYIITGDNSISDMGLEYDLDSAKFVKKKERQVTEIYYE